MVLPMTEETFDIPGLGKIMARQLANEELIERMNDDATQYVIYRAVVPNSFQPAVIVLNWDDGALPVFYILQQVEEIKAGLANFG